MVLLTLTVSVQHLWKDNRALTDRASVDLKSTFVPGGGVLINASAIASGEASILGGTLYQKSAISFFETLPGQMTDIKAENEVGP